MMEVRTSITTITLFIALLFATATGNDLESSDLFDVTHSSSDYGIESDADYRENGRDGNLLRRMITRLMRGGQPTADNVATLHRILAAVSEDDKIIPHEAVPQLQYDVLGVKGAAQLQNWAGDTIVPDFDKRGRCKGRKCRKVEGLNPNANYRPLPFGKRFWFSSAELGTSSGKMSNKRGRVKGRLRPRVPPSRKDFLPFGRR